MVDLKHRRRPSAVTNAFAPEPILSGFGSVKLESSLTVGENTGAFASSEVKQHHEAPRDRRTRGAVPDLPSEPLRRDITRALGGREAEDTRQAGHGQVRGSALHEFLRCHNLILKLIIEAVRSR